MSTTSTAFTIRPATAVDTAAMDRLDHASAIHHEAVDPDRWRAPSLEEVAIHRRHWSNAKPRDEALVAVDEDGRVIGMTELWLRRPSAVPGSAMIQRVAVNLAIAVDPAWRGRGVGTALL
ncbi:MAG TPA: GNAT family N-acetyltransferase, partial [Candidatus Limnocylindrales bacterium]|nr:GNAT family N-acetyltransferase [Candidatus Limnocylindrales bacterium]